MKFIERINWTRSVRLGTLIATVLLVAACATTPSSPLGASEARAKLSALQSNPNLAQHAPVEIREAEEAVRVAEQPLSRSSDSALAAHRVYLADHKVEIATARANTRYAESQRKLLAEERERARLAARTREADRAHAEAQLARGQANRALADAQRSRTEANRARTVASAARMSEAQSEEAAERRAAELQRRIEDLEAEKTSRGLVVTLGDVLFATASAELQGGATANLDKLVNFLNQYPDRSVHVEGHTDNVGESQYNRDLSRRRAESVRHFLARQGIASNRITTAGIGMDRPVASNASASGRQMNRRVEVIIENAPESQASVSPR